MEKENLEIRKASEELTAEDLERVNGGACKRKLDGSKHGDSPKKCSCD